MNAVHEGLRRFLHTHSGICLGPEKDYLIDSRLPALLRQHGLKDGPELLERLRAAPQGGVAASVISSLATHETFWFRDARAFDALRLHLIPRWRARGGRRLAIWSAACSTGQEIYSVAMLLAQEGLLAPVWPTTLLASDICEESLRRAREGVYSAFEIERGLGSEWVQRHFDAQPGGWRIDARLRQAVRFERINLLDIPVLPGAFDAIFCRNVLIYFDRDTQREVLESLHGRLAEEGWLFLGHAESPLGLCEDLFVPGPVPGVYCKRC